MREFEPADKKADFAVPGRTHGPIPISPRRSAFSILKSRWLATFGRGIKSPAESSISGPGKLGKQNISGELHGVIDVLDAGLRRILLNNVLRGWSRWWNWILIGLVVAAAAIPRLAGATIAATILTVIGGTFVVFWTWWTRPSTYDVACRLDSAAGLHDRISTALYFGGSAHPDRIIERQRQDALTKSRNLDVRALFPVRTPATARRTLALALVVAGLFTYRMYHSAPIISLLQTTARSRLVQSLLAPPTRNAETGPQRPEALANQNAEPAAKRPDESAQPADDSFVPAKGAVAGELAPGENSGDPNGDPSAKENGRPAFSQALLDALKGLFANQPPPAGSKANAQNSQQGDPNQANPGDGADSRDPQQGPDSKQNNPKGSANGAGDQQAGTKELKKNTPLAVKAVPDRVPLKSVNLKDQPLIDASAEAGTAKIATGNTSAQTRAVVDGAEQENIPARYRSYVQRYFQHAGNGKTVGSSE